MEINEVKQLLQAFAETNSAQTKAMITELLTQQANPPLSAEALAEQKKMWEARVELAKIVEQSKERKRRECDPSFAAPGRPHRRTGMEHGIHNGSSVIQWAYPTFSVRDAEGRRYETGPIPHGVCKWCMTEFKPGDPDYEEMLSLGTTPIIGGNFQMNVRNGNWV